MFAVVKLAGAQYMVKENDIIKVNKLDYENGEEFLIEDILSVIDGTTTKIGFTYN